MVVFDGYNDVHYNSIVSFIVIQSVKIVHECLVCS